MQLRVDSVLSSDSLQGKSAEDSDGNVGKTIRTNYRRQKTREFLNKADICAVLLWHKTSTAPFPRCLQTVADISRTNVHRFVQRKETLE